MDNAQVVAPLINSTPLDPTNPQLQRHFSAFALTSHLHTPALRLVSLHPALTLAFGFARVPEIHDDFHWTCYFGRESTVDQVLQNVIEELGLTKSLPIPGAGTLVYCMEEVWSEDDSESTFPCPEK